MSSWAAGETPELGRLCVHLSRAAPTSVTNPPSFSLTRSPSSSHSLSLARSSTLSLTSPTSQLESANHPTSVEVSVSPLLWM